MRLLTLLFLGLACCGYDTSTVVNVGPSAEPHMDKILEAVERLNEEIGEETYSLRMVDSDQRVDGEVILRVAEDLGLANAHEVRIGNTKKTHEGVVIRIDPRATPSAIAHELGHAAGLEHVDDRTNLMFRETAPTRWGLNEDQLARLRDH